MKYLEEQNSLQLLAYQALEKKKGEFEDQIVLLSKQKDELHEMLLPAGSDIKEDKEDSRTSVIMGQAQEELASAKRKISEL